MCIVFATKNMNDWSALLLRPKFNLDSVRRIFPVPLFLINFKIAV